MKVYMNAEKGAPMGDLKIVNEGNVLRLFFDWQLEEPVEEDADLSYRCENIDVVGDRDYGSIISAIVNGRYSPDDVQAIMANYELAKDSGSNITEEKRAEYIADYAAFQEWRAHAKDVATRVLMQLNA